MNLGHIRCPNMHGIIGKIYRMTRDSSQAEKKIIYRESNLNLIVVAYILRYPAGLRRIKKLIFKKKKLEGANYRVGGSIGRNSAISVQLGSPPKYISKRYFVYNFFSPPPHSFMPFFPLLLCFYPKGTLGDRVWVEGLPWCRENPPMSSEGK